MGILFNKLSRLFNKIFHKKQQPYIKFTINSNKHTLVECFWENSTIESEQIELVRLFGSMIYLLESSQLHSLIKDSLISYNKKYGTGDVANAIDYFVQMCFNNAMSNMVNVKRGKGVVVKPSEVFKTPLPPPSN